MTLKIWARTLLTVQKYLERICNSIDACIEKKAMASSFVNSKNMYNNDCASVADWIINMSERKKQLINLNVICISALKGIERNFAKILALKYFDRMSSADIAAIMDLSERTYFRKLNSAHDSFESWLAVHGYDAEYFENNFKNEGWIMEVYFDTEKLYNCNITKNNVLNLSPLYLEKIYKIAR